MKNLLDLNENQFRKILLKNIIAPLVAGLISAVLFVALILYLLNALKWVAHTETVIGKTNEVAKLTVDMQTGLRGYLITGEESFLAPYRSAKSKFGVDIAALMEITADNPAQTDRLKKLSVMQQDWDEYAQRAIELRRNNQDYAALVRSRGAVEFDAIRSELDEFQNTEKELLSSRNQAAEKITITSVAVYLLITFVLTGVLSYIGRRELMKLSISYGASLQERQKHADLLEEQAWQRDGQVQLSELTLGQNSLNTIGETTLDFLANYLGVIVAALYVRSEADGKLQRVASFGASKEDEQKIQEYVANESLVGQTMASKRMLQLSDIPDHYLKINSGLGEMSPRHIILAPLRYEGQTKGVIELGFLKEPQKRDVEFVSIITANIGSTLEAAMSRIRLQKAFEETQQLNEELQVQQEELRTSNEELEEQSRALEESQILLESQKAELEQINEKLVDQAAALDQKNTTLNTVQIELEARAQELQRASKYKSEFLANMSHELRTPLNSSMILAKLLAENSKGNLNDEQIQFAKSIYSAGNDLLNLINDILDISKVEAGKLELVPEDVSLQRLADSLQMAFKPLAEQKKLEFVSHVDTTINRTINTDQQRLEQILKNLLSNALKFTEKGHIKLSITKDANTGIIFSVTDSGIGIAPDQQQIIFEAFQQADGSISRRYGGTGLGLSISRDLAHLLGGSISVVSDQGKGSTFSLHLPFTMPDAAAPALEIPIVTTPVTSASSTTPVTPTFEFPDDRHTDLSNGRTVLVIEDDIDFAKILFALAHDEKYQCLVANTAAQGISMACDFVPDAILLDLGLPDTSGMSVLQKLKSNPLTRHIPVHIVSASDRAEAAMQLGAMGYIVKPTTRERLRDVFEKIESKLTQKMKKVLLVEDDELQRKSVTQLIGDDDIEITAVESGAEAIAHLNNTIFDCMIIDLKLPDMQGHELLQRMSVEDICSFPPVIVYTGRNLTRDEENNLLKYSRSIIIKGARSPERLLDEVTLFLHKVESQLSTERQSMLKTVRGRDRALEGRKILLVDDDMRNIFALSGALEQKGAIIEVGRNGFEAISKLNETPEIDLVLMDIMMPGMDGLEATRRIRADERFQKLPIIAVTAKAMKDDQEQCLKAGASDYLAKPIDIDRLYSLLRVWMPSLERI
ncbi:MAG: response regulator [Gammaproteobacteria bacterium]|nr:MAG: response regulator [Gammaproteobacteria bacterium]